MARKWTINLAIGIVLFGLGTSTTAQEPAAVATQAQSETTILRGDQQQLVDWAFGRFATQGLPLPTVNVVFHDSLLPCNGHKGQYWDQTKTLEMCSLDKHTMLHELAHAWANTHMSEQARLNFMTARGLASWNNPEAEWDQRGTEHVAETVAWALGDESNHVKWVEGNEVTYRVLTIGVDVEALTENFVEITGLNPIFRHVDEWTDEVETAVSLEIARLGR